MKVNQIAKNSSKLNTFGDVDIVDRIKQLPVPNYTILFLAQERNMEADPQRVFPQGEGGEVKAAGGLEEQQEQEDPWFDDDSDKEEKEEEEEAGEAKELSVAMEALPAEERELEQLRELQGYDHHVDYNYLVLLIVLASHRMIDLRQIAGLREGYVDLLARQRKLIVKTTSEQAARAAIDRISDYLDRLSVLQLKLHGDSAAKFSNFRKLKDVLRRDGVVMFGTSAGERRQLFIGGVMLQSELKLSLEKLRCYRVVQVFMRAFRNTRSYKLILNELLELDCIKHALNTFNQVRYAEVCRRNRQRELRLTLASASLKDLTSNDYERELLDKIRMCCVVAFCFTPTERFLEKPKADGMAFKVIHERAVKKSYLYVMGGQKEWVAQAGRIREEVGRLGEVVGVRIFYHLFPNLHSFHFSTDRYYFFRYPHNRPYSVSVSARTREGFSFNWEAFLDRLTELCAGGEADALIE